MKCELCNKSFNDYKGLSGHIAKTHKIKIGTVTYTIGAYNYAIVSAKTVGSNFILCDGINRGKVTVQL